MRDNWQLRKKYCILERNISHTSTEEVYKLGQNTKNNHFHKENLILGILAHVDAGKTTLTEALLHSTGAVRKAGRVDHGDAFLDNNAMERERGITIYSKQARFTVEEGEQARTYTLLDTPGHADFSTEMERVLSVLDYAVLVISALDGVNGQVRILWRLLQHYKVPAFIFVNKMDQQGADKAALMEQIHAQLGNHCVDFDADQNVLWEELAVCDEQLMGAFLEGNPVTDADIQELIRERKAYPVLFGSALREEGVQELLSTMQKYAVATSEDSPLTQEPFGARIFKITRDGGARLTWIKVTSGSLKVKTVMEDCKDEKGASEKVEQLRLYSGEKYESRTEVFAGEVCAVTGLTQTKAGTGLGIERDVEAENGLLQPVIRCALILPPGEDLFKVYRNLRVLEEEDPMLHLTYDEEKKEITMQVMGQVQREILQRVIKERFDLRVEFGQPSIVYKETIANTVEGVGHFEPLRHYAEVHLLLEPGEPGSGMVFENRCRSDVMATSWQRLVMTHLEEKMHRGVLVGAPVTDMKITLLSGKAHEKHTEGGDFRQATYRAVRHGLMKAQSVLLEPYFQFRLELPQENLGRAMTDLQGMDASFGQPDLVGNQAVITGSAPVATIGNYSETLATYTRGMGQLTCTLKGYEPCHNAEEVVEETGYDPELDRRNPSASVFCSHGVGTIIPWYEVESYMHLENAYEEREDNGSDGEAGELLQGVDGRGRALAGNYGSVRKKAEAGSFAERERAYVAEEEELRRIFERTYGPIKSRVGSDEEEGGFWTGRKWNGAKSSKSSRTIKAPKSAETYSGKKNKTPEKQYLLVDGYNIIYAWEELRELAKTNIDSARDRLIDILIDFAGFRSEHLIVVFDAYNVRGGTGEVLHIGGIDVIYTKEAETADLYIEKAAHELSKKYRVTVATSDAVEQIIIYGAGALRMSAKGLLEEVILTKERMRDFYQE